MFTFSTTYQRQISGKRSVQDSNLQGEQTPDRIATGSNTVIGTLQMCSFRFHLLHTTLSARFF